MKIFRIFFAFFLSFIVVSLLSLGVEAQIIQPAPKTLTHTFLDGLRWGFISVLQPCLYAMFPVTVTFFLKRSQSRAQGVKNATLYSISIVGIFTLFSFALTLFFGKDTLYQISTSAAFNIFVFILFMVFGISF